MRRNWLILCVALLAGILAIAAVGCDDDDDGDGAAPTATTAADGEPTAADGGDGDGDGEAVAVAVNLLEFQVVPDPASVAAGSITFDADNVGGTEHELMIIRTDLAPDALPTADDGSVDESGEGIEVLFEIEEFAAGTQESLTVDLEAGAYALICNIVDDTGAHYGLGMTVGFAVTE